MMIELRKEYNELRKQYNLPDFDEFDKEFEIRMINLEEHGILIKTLLRMLLNKLSIYIGSLEPAVSPSPVSLHSMIELQNLKDEEKNKMFEVYKEIVKEYHNLCALDLANFGDIAKAINEFWKRWPKLKSKLKEQMDVLAKSWSREPPKEQGSKFA